MLPIPPFLENSKIRPWIIVINPYVCKIPLLAANVAPGVSPSDIFDTVGESLELVSFTPYLI